MAVTLPDVGKTKSVFSVVDTVAGKASTTVTVENDAVIFTCYVTSLEADATLNILVEEIGDAPNNTIVLARLPQVSRALANPQSISLPVGGVLRLTAEYTGSVNFEMRGRAISGAALGNTSTQSVQVVTSEADNLYRESVLCSLDNIYNTLQRILNHQRMITNIEEDKGNEF